MKQSQLFTKTKKEVPTGEVSKNAQLLIQAGYVYKEMAGAYAFLPLGLKVLKRISDIIREEMNAIGGQELEMTVLQQKSVWESTNRWDDAVVDNWFKTTLKNGNELGLGFTHEEAITNMMTQHINSHKDLPRYPYQIQTKFRNELRAKSGIMRGREFLMKDLYSFSKDKKEHDVFYEQAKLAYTRIFERLGIGEQTFVTFASGGTFSTYSHEFQTISDAGEDIIYVSREKNIAINKEVLTSEVLADLSIKREDLEECKSIEVGNIFTLGTKFSEALNLSYSNEEGNLTPVFMGSYGIGPSRVMGTIVELYSDDKGIVWPKAVAPFQVHLISLCKEDTKDQADALYKQLQEQGIEVLYDDRDARAGQKFVDSDLMGIPLRIVISNKTIEKGEVEYTLRASGETGYCAPEKIQELV